MTAKKSAVASKPKAKGPRTRQTSSRNAILDAAIDLFGHSDLDSVTIRDLEEKSGVAAPTIYHFFGDKRGLYDQAVRTAFDKVHEEITKGVEEIEDPVEAVRCLITKYFEGFSRNTMVTRVLIRNLQTEDETLLHGIISDIYVPSYKLWQTMLNRIRPGAGDGLLPILMMSASVGLGSVAHIRQITPPMPVRPGKKENAAIADLFLSMIANADLGESDIKLPAKKIRKASAKKAS